MTTFFINVFAIKRYFLFLFLSICTISFLFPIVSFSASDQTKPENTTPKNNTDIILEQPFLEGRTNIRTKGGSISILQQYMSQAFTYFAGLTALIAVLVMIKAGLSLVLSGGDVGKRESAKTEITQSFAGLALLFLAGLVLHTVNPTFFTFFGSSNLGSSIPGESTANSGTTGNTGTGTNGGSGTTGGTTGS